MIATSGLKLIDRQAKVSSVVRQELDEGEKPEDLPPPRNLRGVVRRPVPIGRLTLETRRGISRTFRDLKQNVMKELEAAGVLGELHEDAGAYINHGGGQGAKGPVGRGGRPLGDDHRRQITRIWRRGPFDLVGDLLEEEIDSWAIEFGGYLEGQYPNLYTAGAKAGQRMLAIRPDFHLRDPGVLKALSHRANLLRGGVAQDTFDRMRTVLAEEFYLKGKGPLDVAGDLRKEFNWLGKTRSETIARTETLAITSEGTHTLHEASGVELKRWLTTLDGRERPSHFDAHGQFRKIGEPFRIGRALLLYPGDPMGGHPEETINCRCAQIPVVLADQQFVGSDVWRGDVAPDEFAKERIQTAQIAVKMALVKADCLTGQTAIQTGCTPAEGGGGRGPSGGEDGGVPRSPKGEFSGEDDIRSQLGSGLPSSTPEQREAIAKVMTDDRVLSGVKEGKSTGEIAKTMLGEEDDKTRTKFVKAWGRSSSPNLAVTGRIVEGTATEEDYESFRSGTRSEGVSNERIRNIATTQYGITQRQLDFAGKNDLKVYRGVAGGLGTTVAKAHFAGAKKIHVNSRSMSSFSEANNVATGFAVNKRGGHGAVFRVDAPREQAFMHHKFDRPLGKLKENEVAMMSSKGGWEVNRRRITVYDKRPVSMYGKPP